MPSVSDNDAAARTTPSLDPFERLRRQQLLIIRKTSIPGVVLGGGGILLVLWAALYWADDAATRNAYFIIFACGTVMVGLWIVALWHCRRDNLYRAFLAQFAANLVTSVLMFLFIDKGVVMAIITAFTGVCAGASLLDSKTLRAAAWTMTAAVLAAGAAHELGIVQPIAIPRALLYLATACAVASGFRTPIGALSIFNEHLKASRSEALRFARAAEESRKSADAQAQKVREVGDELRDFTYVVSHDLRAPLINIEGFAKVLGDSLEDFDSKVADSAADSAAAADGLRDAWKDTHAEAVESMHFIRRSTEKLNAMVVGLLELSRLDSKAQQDKDVDLAPLVAQIVESLQHQIRARDIEISVAPLPTVLADPLRINQVFTNLIDNAIKYMPERAPRRISILVDDDADGHVFSVSDSGGGIAPEDRAKVFRPFKRLDPNAPAAGEGLGLAAVKKIIERRGGRIWIEDPESGPGTCFRFLWPRVAPAPSESGEARSAA